MSANVTVGFIAHRFLRHVEEPNWRGF